MYNRYVPRADGSYCRTRLPDSPPRQSAPSQPKKETPANTESPENFIPKCKSNALPSHRPSGCQKNSPRKYVPQTPSYGNSVGSFLKQILPKDFDTSDLIVVLLLLLISGDNPDDQNNALLTLALYLFM